MARSVAAMLYPALRSAFNSVILNNQCCYDDGDQDGHGDHDDDGDHDGSDQVGAVALDISGNVASATSTGGITGKRGGRVSMASL